MKRLTSIEETQSHLKADIAYISKYYAQIQEDEHYLNTLYIWDVIQTSNLTCIENKIKYLLHTYGTKEYGNRFDVGNTIEFIICDFLVSQGLNIIEMPNAKRVDFSINDTQFSMKYSKCGDITLHNSNSCINTDISFTSMLLLTPYKMYLITESLLSEYNIDITIYLKNNGDSLKLKRTLLKKLLDIKYKYMRPIDINVTSSRNLLCSKVFYKQFLHDYDATHSNQVHT